MFIGVTSFFLCMLLLLFSYFIVPYKINEGDDIVIDGDIVLMLKIIYIITVFLSGIALLSFLKLRKKIFLVVSALTLIISLYYLGKMFYYFDQFLD